jgi:hypothetical protein
MYGNERAEVPHRLRAPPPAMPGNRLDKWIGGIESAGGSGGNLPLDLYAAEATDSGC